MASINKKNLKLGDKSKFQLVMVGYDRQKAGYEAYLTKGKLSWPAVKLSEKAGLKEALLSKGETGFIPNLVMLKADGTMVSNDTKVVLAKLKKLAKGS